MSTTAVAAIDPDGREPELLGRHMVVEEALRDVQDALPRQPDALEGDLEVVRVRFVAAGHLGGHDPIEVGLEARSRAGEQVVVAVGDDPQPESLPEPPQRLDRIGEGGPLPDRIGERRHVGKIRRDGVVGGDLAQAASEDLAIAQVRPRLEPGLGRGELPQHLVVGRRHSARIQHRTNAGEDAGLPVDERAVAVEGQCLEASVVEIGHRRSVLLSTR